MVHRYLWRRALPNEFPGLLVELDRLRPPPFPLLIPWLLLLGWHLENSDNTKHPQLLCAPSECCKRWEKLVFGHIFTQPDKWLNICNWSLLKSLAKLKNFQPFNRVSNSKERCRGTFLHAYWEKSPFMVVTVDLIYLMCMQVVISTMGLSDCCTTVNIQGGTKEINNCGRGA